nr:hypothetical protein [Tanacetum cinerariifolium]
MFDCDDYLSSESDESWPPSSLYDMFQPSDGYHDVPTPYTGTFMPPKPDLVFNTAPTAIETDHFAFNVHLSLTKPNQDLSHTNRPTAPIIEDWVFDSEDESETKVPQIVSSFVQSTEQVKSPRHSVQHVETSIPAATPKSASPKPTSNGKRMNRKACFVCKSLDHLIKDCDYHEKKMAQPTARNHAHRGNHKKYAPMTSQNSQKHMVPATVLTQSKPVPITVVRPVCTVVPNIKVTRPKQVNPIITNFNSPNRRHITRSPSPNTSISPLRVTTIKAPMVSVAQGKLDFDDVYFVKELKFNLFSVSQMCDKKNSVLFTDTECLVLSLDFKLPNERQVLLRVPRENNMYNVNLKNIIPSRDLNCLFAKATIDESNLWHRRLGHINFKTMNKLDKGNLVRGLPTKVFENDNTLLLVRKASNIELLGIKREFSVPRTPQQNSIAERKNRTLIEVARTMLADTFLPIPSWAEAVNTACYVQNRVLVTKPHNKTPYELLHGRTPSIGFLRPFGCLVTILNTLDSLGKFNGKVDKGFLVGYSNNDGDAAFVKKEYEFDAKKPESEVNVSPSSSAQSKKQYDKTKREAKGKSPVEYFMGYRDLSVEFEDYSKDSINEVNADGTLVPAVGKISPNSTNTFSATDLEDITYSDDEEDVGAEADFKNFETSITEEGIDYEEVFALVARIEAIRLFLAYASFMGFMMYQMDVKSAFLYGTIKEEVYLCQPHRFEDPDHPDKVYKVVKALYGLHQAPREGKSASTPIDTEKPVLRDLDGEDVDVHIYRLMISSLMYLTSSRPDIMFAVCACARFQVTPKASHLHAVKRIFRYLKGKPHLGLWVSKGFSGVKSPLFEGMLVAQKVVVEEDAEVHGEEVNSGDGAKRDVSAAHGEVPTDADVVLEEAKEVAKDAKEDKPEPAKVQEVVDVVTTAKLITEVVTAANETITAANKKYARELEAELNKNIDWDEAIDYVKKKAKEDNAVKRYQAMKRKPQTKAQARKNMMVYLKNTKEQIKEEGSRALKRINVTPAGKAAKRQKLDEEVEELKRHLQIVPNEDDDNANPPPTNNHPVLSAALRVEIDQELHVQLISAFVDSHLESIEQFLNNFANQPNETDMSNLESNDESVDTPFVSLFPHSDNVPGNGKVLNELSKKFTSYVDPFLPLNIISRKAYNTIIAEGLESTWKNLVVVVRDVYACV